MNEAFDFQELWTAIQELALELNALKSNFQILEERLRNLRNE